jgi:two-component system chemotaxis response regulator CheB
MIRVLMVEDSPSVRELLTAILTADPQLQVVGAARDGGEALAAVASTRPDVITMDIYMPRMDGFEATRQIMQTHPTPIVIVSGSADVRELATTFRAMEAGALAVVPRPMGIGHPDHEATAHEFVQTVKLMAEVKVVRRWAHLRRQGLARTPPPPVAITHAPAEVKIVGLGASTGGPIVIRDILAGLPKEFPVPVLVVQHMASGFIQGFTEWLTQSSGFPAQVGRHSEWPLPGHAYIAPDGWHMGVKPSGHIALSRDAPENNLRPAVSYLFRSLADVFGPHAVGVLLTGMGKDGAAELRAMKEKGAITMAQDQASSVVYGMPGEALKLDAATYVLPAHQIAAALVRLANRPGTAG